MGLRPWVHQTVDRVGGESNQREVDNVECLGEEGRARARCYGIEGISGRWANRKEGKGKFGIWILVELDERELSKRKRKVHTLGGDEIVGVGKKKTWKTQGQGRKRQRAKRKE